MERLSGVVCSLLCVRSRRSRGEVSRQCKRVSTRDSLETLQQHRPSGKRRRIELVIATSHCYCFLYCTVQFIQYHATRSV